MMSLGEGGWIALITASVGITTVMARVIEKLVVHALENRKNGHRKNSQDLLLKKGGNTTDLALQRAQLDDLEKSIDEIGRVSQEVHTLASKDIPYRLEKFNDLIALNKEVLKELQELRRAVENNTAATKALHNYLATRGGRV